MLDRFQSVSAIADQIARGARYVFITVDGQTIGYAADIPDVGERRLQISKLYVKKIYREKGVGRAALNQIVRDAKALGIHTIWLTVNRHNHIAIKAYERFGFKKVKALVTDIGGGFVMDDFEMVLTIDSL